MNEIREHDRVVLTADLAAEEFAAGDVGTAVHVYRDEKAFEVEFVAQERTQVRPVGHREIAHARRVA